MSDILHFDDLSIAAESDAYVNIVELLDVLDCKLMQISHEARISRADASALVERFAVQFDTRTPLASFTEHSSSTNVSIALEGILASAGKYLLELLKKVVAILMKIFDWTLTFFGFTRDRERRIRRFGINFEQVQLANQKLRATRTTASSNTEIDLAYTAFNDRYNGLWSDMLGSSQILTMLRNLENDVFTLQDFVRTQLVNVRTAIAKGTVTEISRVHASQAAIVSRFNRSTLITTATDSTPKSLMTAFSMYVTQQSLLHEHEVIDPAIALNQVTKSRHGIMAPILLSDKIGARSVRDLINELRALPSTLPPKMSSDTQQQIQKYIAQLLDNALTVQLYFNIVNQYGHARDMMFTAIWGHAAAQYRALYTSAMASTDLSVRRVAEETAHVFKSRMQR